MRLLLIVLLMPIAAFAFQNEPDGFRGINWGDDQILHAEQLTEADRKDDVVLYSRKDDPLKIGGADLSSIYYRYKNGKFTSVVIHTDGMSNQMALVDSFESQFGRGSKPNRYMDKYHWYGTKAFITINCIKIKKTCTATLMSGQALKEEIAERKRDASNAASDF